MKSVSWLFCFSSNSIFLSKYLIAFLSDSLERDLLETYNVTREEIVADTTTVQALIIEIKTLVSILSILIANPIKWLNTQYRPNNSYMDPHKMPGWSFLSV